MWPQLRKHRRAKATWATIPEAIEEFRKGRPLVVVDSADRENEGDLCIPAALIDDAGVNFMATHGRGLICLTLAPDKCDQLRLEQMAASNGAQYSTAFTVSIEAREGVTTGISAADRAHTIRTAVREGAGPNDLVSPGHIFPLRAKPGGVLERPGHTEASVDLARMAGLAPAGVICEILNDDGTMARVPDLERYCAKHHLRMVSIEDLIAWRSAHEGGIAVDAEAEEHEVVPSVEHVAVAQLPTKFGEFAIHGYRARANGAGHVALVRGDVDGAEDVLIRMHSQCATGDVFGSLRCDCGDQLEAALSEIDRAGRGILLYLAHEGRGIGLLNKLRAYALQEDGLDTVDANLKLGFTDDLRDYDVAADMLRDLGVQSVQLLTNNPAKLSALTEHGMTVTGRVGIEVSPVAGNVEYLRTKRDRMGHLLVGELHAELHRLSHAVAHD
jgi:3,4-dihydroxy 2-butanone 4-phosphate synthase/GTP cyclohydrolase II